MSDGPGRADIYIMYMYIQSNQANLSDTRNFVVVAAECDSLPFLDFLSGGTRNVGVGRGR